MLKRFSTHNSGRHIYYHLISIQNSRARIPLDPIMLHYSTREWYSLLVSFAIEVRWSKMTSKRYRSFSTWFSKKLSNFIISEKHLKPKVTDSFILIQVQTGVSIFSKGSLELIEASECLLKIVLFDNYCKGRLIYFWKYAGL